MLCLTNFPLTQALICPSYQSTSPVSFAASCPPVSVSPSTRVSSLPAPQSETQARLIAGMRTYNRLDTSPPPRFICLPCPRFSPIFQISTSPNCTSRIVSGPSISHHQSQASSHSVCGITSPSLFTELAPCHLVGIGSISGSPHRPWRSRSHLPHHRLGVGLHIDDILLAHSDPQFLRFTTLYADLLLRIAGPPSLKSYPQRP